jgi:hypothetical protein
MGALGTICASLGEGTRARRRVACGDGETAAPAFSGEVDWGISVVERWSIIA